MRLSIHDQDTSLGRKLYHQTEKVLKRLFFDIRLEYIKDSSKLLDLGIPGKTALFIDDELICLDQCPEESELLKTIEEKITH